LEKILVTGAAGFIGYNLVCSLLKDGNEVCGIDNINDYYDPKLKIDRLNNLKKFTNFVFHKINLTNRSVLETAFKKFRPDKVVNLAAQAGVRYSLKNPYVYMDTNLVGFLNIIELCRKNNVKGFIYASSSSVYGGNTKIPFSVDDAVDRPISLYAATKKANELIAHSYSHLYKLNTTGLRYFTVYGPWGRPDMAMYIFTSKIIEGKSIPVFNNGNMKRDFTYISDIIDGTRLAIEKNYKCEVFNLGNNRSEQLMEVVHQIEKYIGKSAKIKYLPMQLGDIPESFADIKKSQEMLGYTPSVNINIGIIKFIQWYMEYHNVSL